MRSSTCGKDLVLLTRKIAEEYHTLRSKLKKLGKYSRTRKYLTPDGKIFDNALEALLHLKRIRKS